MNWLHLLQARVAGICRNRQLRNRINDEVSFHLAMRTREYIEQGLSPAEAAAQAQRRFGNVNLVRDACHDERGGGILEELGRDLRFAARVLLKDRAFTAVAVCVLALTIGANTAVFTLVNGVLLRPLPFPDSGQLVAIWSSDEKLISRVRSSHAQLEAYRAENGWFERLGAYAAAEFTLSSETGDTARIAGARLTADVFPMLDVAAAVGQTLLRATDGSSAPAAVITDRLWEERWARAAGVIGMTVAIDGREHRIIGILPPDFRFPRHGRAPQIFSISAAPDYWAENAEPSRHQRHWQLIGRLKRDVNVSQARVGLSEVSARLAAEFPETYGWLPTCDVAPLLEDVVTYARPQLLLLFGAALCVLGVGCANLSNLAFARASSRRKELAVRSALGAGRWRIFRQLLTESVLLAAIGGLMGCVAAFALTRYITAVLPAEFPRIAEITPDARVLFFAGAIMLATVCLFGVAPAWSAARSAVISLANDTAGTGSPVVERQRVRSTLLACEFILAFVLLTAAGFLLRGVWHLQNVPVGFNARDLLTVRLALPPDEPDGGMLRQSGIIYDDLLRRVAELPDVQAASLASALPLVGRRSAAHLEFSGASTAPDEQAQVFTCAVAQGFFATMGVPFVGGRDFAPEDRSNGSAVTIITRSVAQRYFPGQNPIGQRITVRMSADRADAREREIIGIVADLKFTDLTAEKDPGVFIPFAEHDPSEARLLIRSKATPEALMSGLRHILADAEPGLAAFEAAKMEQHVAALIAQPRLNSSLLAGYAGIAVLLTGIGVYGVTAYSVAQRRREIGIRLALGASRQTICRLIVSDGVQVLRWAIPIGATCTVMAIYLMRDFLRAPTAFDASIVPAVALLVIAVSAAASWLPAHRATKIDPMIALRCD